MRELVGSNALRLLTDEEVALIAGGETITVVGPDWDVYYEHYYDDDYNHYVYDDRADGGGDGESYSNEPNCDESNAVTILVAPDGAKYFLPEGVTAKYLQDALNHLSNFANTHTAAELLLEFKYMYTDASHPHYIDFKDWGTSNGPAGSMGADPVTYWSDAAGSYITSSPFEAFGNFFYGYAGTWAGISPDVLYAAAALLQEGDTGMIPSDAPEDQPHVNHGIAAARAYAANPITQMGVVEGTCATGTTTKAVSSSSLQQQADYMEAYNDSSYHDGLWLGLEYAYDIP